MALTPGDIEMLRRAMIEPEFVDDEAYKWNGYVRDANVGLGAITGWFLTKPTREFPITPLVHQWRFHHSKARNILMKAGIAAGKSSVVGMSATAFCLTTEDFSFTNTAPTAGQADLVYLWLKEYIDNNPRIQPYVTKMVSKPYPQIHWLSGARMDFRTAGVGGVNLRGIERDWINYDEGAFDTRLEETHTALTGRLRGLRPNGLPRLGRFSLSSSPSDLQFFRELWERGTDPLHPAYDPQSNFCLTATIYDNVYLLPEQVQNIVDSIPAEIREVELMGELPEGTGSIFPRHQVDAMQQLELNHTAEGVSFDPDTGDEYRQQPPTGYDVQMQGYTGITRYVKPPKQGHAYVLGGDPGRGNPPNRNAGVVMVWDVTHSPYELVYFDWVSGNDSIFPFVQSYRFAMELYQPIQQGIDSTGTQAYLAEILNEQFKEQLGEYAIEGIRFNRDKDGMITALRTLLARGGIVTPAIKGISTQMKRYVVPDKDITQDIVCAMMMCAWLARFTSSYVDEGYENRQRDSRSGGRARRNNSSYNPPFRGSHDEPNPYIKPKTQRRLSR